MLGSVPPPGFLLRCCRQARTRSPPMRYTDPGTEPLRATNTERWYYTTKAGQNKRLAAVLDIFAGKISEMRLRASWRASRLLSGALSRSGNISPSTRPAPRARTARVTTTAESIPPLSPTMAPSRRKSSTALRMNVVKQAATSARSIRSSSRSGLFLPVPLSGTPVAR